MRRGSCATFRSVASAKSAVDHDGQDSDGIAARFAQRLQSFGHDFVFVVDRRERLLYSARRDGLITHAGRSDLAPVLSQLRGRPPPPGASYLALDPHSIAAPAQVALVQRFAGRPALVIGVAAESPRPAPLRGLSPAFIAVHFIDGEVLSDIAGRLQLHHLRLLPVGAPPTGDDVYDIADGNGRSVVRFAWTPQKPGAQIVESVFPFIVIALCGFAVLTAFVLRYMRRSATTIALTEKRLRYLAMHDPLCGLPNRIYFSEQLEQVIANVRDHGPAAAVFYIDLDHFKDVNDVLGHPVGDALIEAVAQRLRRVMRDEDVVARLGGDEFAVIRFTAPDPTALQGLAERIISTLCEPYPIAEQSIVIGASIGIAVIDRHALSAAEIMRHADMALYRAKSEGRSRACRYDAAMDAELLYRKQMQDDLREAVAGDGLRLEYQPIVSPSGEKVIGVEALARWRHPLRGEIPPAEFVSIAEQSGLIIDLGTWVLRRACCDAIAWPDLMLAINVSPLQFRRADFVDVVEDVLTETGFDPSRLELEVTETTLLGNVESAQAAMQRLKALGVKLALDDFGTGYSSLQYLRRFPFDRLKIDQSFVRSIENAAEAAAIVHAIVSLGRGLGMKVTAEGVETAEQQLFLRAAGVHAMQGFRFGRPMPAGDMAERRLAQPERRRHPLARAG